MRKNSQSNYTWRSCANLMFMTVNMTSELQLHHIQQSANVLTNITMEMQFSGLFSICLLIVFNYPGNSVRLHKEREQLFDILLPRPRNQVWLLVY